MYARVGQNLKVRTAPVTHTLPHVTAMKMGKMEPEESQSAQVTVFPLSVDISASCPVRVGRSGVDTGRVGENFTQVAETLPRWDMLMTSIVRRGFRWHKSLFSVEADRYCYSSLLMQVGLIVYLAAGAAGAGRSAR